jgi:hypothetical protein
MAASSASSARGLYNSNLTRAAGRLAHFDCAVYGFNSSHFWSTIRERGLPFWVVLACNPFVHGQALLRKVSECKIITNSAPALLDHIRGLGVMSKLAGYLIHSHRYSSTEPTSRYWDIQFNIVRQLHIICALSIVVVFVHPDHDCCTVLQSFFKRLHANGWVITDVPVSYPDFGESLIGRCRLIVAIHSNTEPNCKAFAIHTPPSVPLRPITQFLWAPFNMPEHAILFAQDDPLFNLHAVNNNGAPCLVASTPTSAQLALLDVGMHIAYYLHRK